jgi:hypothetical protein
LQTVLEISEIVFCRQFRFRDAWLLALCFTHVQVSLGPFDDFFSFPLARPELGVLMLRLHRYRHPASFEE